MQDIKINNELLVAERLPNDCRYTYTLASRLGDMLDKAERLFGPRDTSYTILGIEFTSDIPYIWHINDSQIIIRLNLCAGAAKNTSQAYYQLAHETVHLLAPTGGNHATNFEEGVACYFAFYYMEKVLGEPNWHPTLPSYKRALERIRPHLDADISCVRRLREHQPSFSKLGRKEIVTEIPNLTSDAVNFLISKFNRDSN